MGGLFLIDTANRHCKLINNKSCFRTCFQMLKIKDFLGRDVFERIVLYKNIERKLEQLIHM